MSPELGTSALGVCGLGEKKYFQAKITIKMEPHLYEAYIKITHIPSLSHFLENDQNNIFNW